MTSSSDHQSESGKWLRQATERGVDLDFLEGVDLTDRNHKDVLYQMFNISNDVRQQAKLLAFVRKYQLKQQKEIERNCPDFYDTQQNVLEECKKELVKLDWKPEPFQLSNFEPPKEALFHPIFKQDSKVPIDPNAPSTPSLLLYDLGNSSHTQTNVYDQIHQASKKGPSVIYGTSGIGKTRSCFEFLSHNYGFYFVAKTGHNDGSGDIELVLERLCEPVLTKYGKGKVAKAEQNAIAGTNAAKDVSEKNYETVQSYLKLMLMARLAVFLVLKESLGDLLTPHQWLLVQLSPSSFLGDDIFVLLTQRWIQDGRRVDIPFPDVNFTCFIDEAQHLKKKLPDFFLSDDGTRPRSAYKAFLKAFSQLSKGQHRLSYPVFSGTGLSLWSLKEETESFMAKPLKYNPIYTKLEPLKIPDVRTYLKRFLNLKVMGDDLVSHVAAWLCGRPRWAAAFLQTFLVQKKKGGHYRIPRGNFDEAEKGLIEAIDRFVDRATSDQNSDSNRRLSWELTRSAYFSVSELYEREKSSQEEAFATFELQQAAFRLALTGKGKAVTDKTASLMELGLASVVVSVGENYVKCKVDEPLIVQSCINYFGMDKVVQAEMSMKDGAVEKGIAFESFLIPALQGKWKDIVDQQLNNSTDIGSYEVPQLSAYGVLAESCGNVKETVAWLRKSLQARFEGTVPPFCKPDSRMGPDVLFFLSNPEFLRRLGVIQSKFKDTSTANLLQEALRTICPKLFFCKNLDSHPAINLNEEDTKLWREQEQELFHQYETVEVAPSKKHGHETRSNTCAQPKKKKRRQTEVVRMLVQYPCAAQEAAPGFVPVDSILSTKKAPVNDPHDTFLVIDLNNAKDMFGVETEFLNHVKEDKYKDVESSTSSE